MVITFPMVDELATIPSTTGISVNDKFWSNYYGHQHPTSPFTMADAEKWLSVRLKANFQTPLIFKTPVWYTRYTRCKDGNGYWNQVETASESDASPSSCAFEGHQTIDFWTWSRDNRSNSHLFGVILLTGSFFSLQLDTPSILDKGILNLRVSLYIKGLMKCVTRNSKTNYARTKRQWISRRSNA